MLREAVGSRAPHLLALVSDACAGQVLTGEEANQIRDALGAELAETGVEGDPGTINERGRRLDDLIDAVGRASTLFDH